MFLEFVNSSQGCDDVELPPHNVDHRKTTGHIKWYFLSLILTVYAYDIPLRAIEMSQILDTILTDHLFYISIR